jgi:ribosomal protein L4
MALRPRFEAALRQAIAEKAENEGSEAVPVDTEDNGGEDEDTTKAMARLFAELGEAYVELVASGSQEAVIMAQAMLEVRRRAFSCRRERGGACERGRVGS